jgi:hypothetical protein
MGMIAIERLTLSMFEMQKAEHAETITLVLVGVAFSASAKPPPWIRRHGAEVDDRSSFAGWTALVLRDVSKPLLLKGGSRARRGWWAEEDLNVGNVIAPKK